MVDHSRNYSEYIGCLFVVCWLKHAPGLPYAGKPFFCGVGGVCEGVVACAKILICQPPVSPACLYPALRLRPVHIVVAPLPPHTSLFPILVIQPLFLSPLVIN